MPSPPRRRWGILRFDEENRALSRLDRREALRRMGLGAAGLMAAGLPASAVTPSNDLLDLSERLRLASDRDAFAVAARAIRAGADRTTLLGAIFLCGLREIRPRPHGILHTVMVVESSFRLAELAEPGDEWLPVLWNLDDLKRSMARDRIEDGDWVLPARPSPRAKSERAARREFLAAMEGWDAGRADRALVDLLPHHRQETFFEILWPLLLRCSAFIGHKMIYGTQVERVLRRIGWAHAEPALRSLVMTVLVDRQTGAFERSEELARRLPEGWPRGRAVPGKSEELLRELRVATPTAAQDRVVQALGDGLGPGTVWDALRLFGSEVFLRRPGRSASTGRSALLPVHALTVMNAFGHAWASTTLDRTRRLLILQAAAWLASIRDDLVGIVGLSMKGAGIEALGLSDGEAASGVEGDEGLAPALKDASPAAVRRRLDRNPSDAAPYLAHLRRAVFRTAQEAHQLKYAAAMAEESRRVDPRWTSRILAPGVDYLANPQDAETDVYRRSRQTLREAGLSPAASSALRRSGAGPRS